MEQDTAIVLCQGTLTRSLFIDTFPITVLQHAKQIGLTFVVCLIGFDHKCKIQHLCTDIGICFYKHHYSDEIAVSITFTEVP